MRRIMVMGPPGSGKSTLARRLGQQRGCPVFHLDQAFHAPGWTPVPAELFQAEVDRIAALPEWVIDGNYTGSIASRFAAADTIIYLHVATWLSMARIVRRTITSYGTVRPDSAPGCPERLNFEFIRFVWSWNRIRRSRHLAIVSEFGGRTIILRGGRQQRQLFGKS